MKQLKRWLRRAWNWLTSMRTALVLLFLLALGAIPGALLPQRDLNEQNVNEFIASHGRVAETYDKLDLFDVFSSGWFIAIFTLLTISLIGCIIPRTWEHYKAWKTPPVRPPRYLQRMPMHAVGDTERDFDDIATRVRGQFTKWRVREFDAEEDRAGQYSFAAERGYTRELGNLVFHIGLVLILLTAAVGQLLFYEGQVIVVTGSGKYAEGEAPAQQSEFCNTSTSNFDSFRAGNLVDGTKMHPFCMKAHDFAADYLPNGQAEMFTSHVSYAEGDDIYTDESDWKDYTLRVNHPLRLAKNSVFLQGHGFAPTVTIEWPDGEKRTQTMQFRPDDQVNFLSSGVMRFDPPAGMYPDLQKRRENQIALQGLFAPTAEWAGENGALLQSKYPAMTDPALAIDIYRGDAGLDTGSSQSLFSLDESLVQSGVLQKIDRVNMQLGETVTLDDGTRVTFDGANEYANYQVSHNPMKLAVLLSALLTLGGLIVSLAIKRRRVWVRLTPLEGGGTHVEMAGLSRTDRAGWGEEFERMHRELLELPDPDEVEEDRIWVDEND